MAEPLVILFCTDLLFGVQLQNMAKQAGLRAVTMRPGVELPGGEMLIVDLEARGDWEIAIREASQRGMPVVAFGPHMDAEARRKAKAAGASRVLTNSNLTRELPRLLEEIIAERRR